MYCKIDEGTVPRVPGESAQYHEMTSLNRIPAVTETDANSTQRDGINFGRRKVEDDKAVFCGGQREAAFSSGYQQFRPGREFCDGTR